MLKAVRIISVLLAMTFGFIWTVGQAGLDVTNKNLCDLVAAVSWRPISDCQFPKWILWLWGIGALAALLFLIIDGVRWIRERLNSAHSRPNSWERKTKDIRTRYIEKPLDPTREREELDYNAEVVQARKDLALILALVQGRIKLLGDAAKRRSIPIKLSQHHPIKQRQIYGAVASDWTAHSNKVEDATRLVRAISNEILQIQEFQVRHFQISSRAQYDELKDFASAMAETYRAGTQASDQLDTMSSASLSVRGRTGELNQAATRVSTVTNELIAEFRRYAGSCRDVAALATSRLAEVKALYDP